LTNPVPFKSILELDKQQVVNMNHLPLFVCIITLCTIGISGCQSEAPTNAKAEVAFKHQDNVVYARLPAEPDNLNPCLATNTYSRAIYEQLFLNLLQFNPDDLVLTPELAKSRPEILETTDGVAYTFEILEAAKWDNGSPITARDFAFTLKAILNPKVNAAQVRSYLEFITDMVIDPENPKKFTVFTDGKYTIGEAVIGNIPPMPAYFYDPGGLLENITVKQLADEENVDGFAAQTPELETFARSFNSQSFAREKISGSGAYRFVEWVSGQKVVIEKKQGWWGEALATENPLLKAAPEKIVYKIIPDQIAMLAALKDQQIDVATQIDAKDFVDLKENTSVQPYFSLHAPVSLVYYFIGFNNKSPKLADKRVRRALAHLLDVDEVIESLYYGYAQRTVGPIHPVRPYYHKELKPIPFSPEQARQLLAEAGWEDTNNNGIVDKELNGQLVDLEIDYKISTTKFANNMAILFKENAKKAGVKLNIIPRDFSVLIQDTKKRDYEMYAGAWAQDPNVDDPKQLWHSESDTPDGGNRVSFINERADQLIEAIRTTLDEEKRNELFYEFQELIYEEQPYIFLIAPLERIAISKRFDASASSRRPGFFPNTFVQQDAKQ
jgi:ABC-type transport system substrate-binding protein